MSLVARAALRSRQVQSLRFAAQHRSMHVENVVGNATPFKHEIADRVSFAVKLTAFVVTGAAIPFVAAYYQLSKSAPAS